MVTVGGVQLLVAGSYPTDDDFFTFQVLMSVMARKGIYL
jgi:hypothetical protein